MYIIYNVYIYTYMLLSYYYVIIPCSQHIFLPKEESWEDRVESNRHFQIEFSGPINATYLISLNFNNNKKNTE